MCMCMQRCAPADHDAPAAPRRRLHSRRPHLRGQPAVSCVVGIYAHERQRPQPLRIDIEMEVDTRPAAHRGSPPRSTTLPWPNRHASSSRWVASSSSRRPRTPSRGCCWRRPRPTRSVMHKLARHAHQPRRWRWRGAVGEVWRSVEHEAFEPRPPSSTRCTASRVPPGARGGPSAERGAGRRGGGAVAGRRPALDRTATVECRSALPKDAASLRPIDLLQGRPGVLLTRRRHHTVLCVRAGSDLEAPHFDGPGHDAAP